MSRVASTRPNRPRTRSFGVRPSRARASSRSIATLGMFDPTGRCSTGRPGNQPANRVTQGSMAKKTRSAVRPRAADLRPLPLPHQRPLPGVQQRRRVGLVEHHRHPHRREPPPQAPQRRRDHRVEGVLQPPAAGRVLEEQPVGRVGRHRLGELAGPSPGRPSRRPAPPTPPPADARLGAAGRHHPHPQPRREPLGQHRCIVADPARERRERRRGEAERPHRAAPPAPRPPRAPRPARPTARPRRP